MFMHFKFLQNFKVSLIKKSLKFKSPNLSYQISNQLLLYQTGLPQSEFKRLFVKKSALILVAIKFHFLFRIIIATSPKTAGHNLIALKMRVLFSPLITVFLLLIPDELDRRRTREHSLPEQRFTTRPQAEAGRTTSRSPSRSSVTWCHGAAWPSEGNNKHLLNTYTWSWGTWCWAWPSSPGTCYFVPVPLFPNPLPFFSSLIAGCCGIEPSGRGPSERRWQGSCHGVGIWHRVNWGGNLGKGKNSQQSYHREQNSKQCQMGLPLERCNFNWMVIIIYKQRV